MIGALRLAHGARPARDKRDPAARHYMRRGADAGDGGELDDLEMFNVDGGAGGRG